MANEHILIVANKTVGGDHLVAVARERVASGATGFWVLVPATAPPSKHEPSGVSLLPRPDTGGTKPVDAYDLAESRLDLAKARLKTLGVPVGGEVGDEDPLKAIGAVLARRQIDEVIISVLPRSVSHWLHVDLPGRVHRKFSVPVTTVAAKVPQRV